MHFYIKRALLGPRCNIFSKNSKVQSVVQKTIPFLYSVFCNENLHECSSYLHAVVLKLSDKSNKTFCDSEQ